MQRLRSTSPGGAVARVNQRCVVCRTTFSRHNSFKGNMEQREGAMEGSCSRTKGIGGRIKESTWVNSKVEAFWIKVFKHTVTVAKVVF